MSHPPIILYNQIIMIRRAKQADAEKISQLIKKNQQSEKGSKKQGFLRHQRGPKKVKKIINKSLVALVFVKKNQIIGFMNAYPQRKPKRKNINWEDKNAKEAYFNEKTSATAFLGVIDPDYLHQGIGSQLLEKMANRLRQQGFKNLFASVTTKPTLNKASLAFVKSKGFTKVAAATVKTDPSTKTTIFIKKL